MFGNKKEKYEKMVAKNQWDKLAKDVQGGDSQKKLWIAQACANSSDDGSFNALSILIRDADEQVQKEAIRSLGVMGNDHATAELQWILTKIPEDRKETIEITHEALRKVRERK